MGVVGGLEARGTARGSIAATLRAAQPRHAPGQGYCPPHGPRLAGKTAAVAAASAGLGLAAAAGAGRPRASRSRSAAATGPARGGGRRASATSAVPIVADVSTTRRRHRASSRRPSPPSARSTSSCPTPAARRRARSPPPRSRPTSPPSSSTCCRRSPCARPRCRPMADAGLGPGGGHHLGVGAPADPDADPVEHGPGRRHRLPQDARRSRSPAQGVTVNSVQPGIHATERFRQLYGDDADSVAAVAENIPVRTVGRAEDFGDGRRLPVLRRRPGSSPAPPSRSTAAPAAASSRRIGTVGAVLTHIVLITVARRRRRGAGQAMVAACARLPAQIDEIQQLQVGRDLGLADGNATVGIHGHLRLARGPRRPTSTTPPTRRWSPSCIRPIAATDQSGAQVARTVRLSPSTHGGSALGSAAMVDAPWTGDACSLVDAFRSGERSPAEELEACARRHRGLRAQRLLASSTTRAPGPRPRAPTRRLPFGGVPVGIKELDKVEGWPDTEASLVFADRIAPHTGTMVERLRTAGGAALRRARPRASEFGGLNISITKITASPTTRGGTGARPAARRAGRPRRWPAGWSRSPAGATAAGSIRIPAGFNGLVGMKGTAGRIPRGPQTLDPPDDGRDRLPGPVDARRGPLVRRHVRLRLPRPVLAAPHRRVGARPRHPRPAGPAGRHRPDARAGDRRRRRAGAGRRRRRGAGPRRRARPSSTSRCDLPDARPGVGPGQPGRPAGWSSATSGRTARTT